MEISSLYIVCLEFLGVLGEKQYLEKISAVGGFECLLKLIK